MTGGGAVLHEQTKKSWATLGMFMTIQKGYFFWGGKGRQELNLEEMENGILNPHQI